MRRREARGQQARGPAPRSSWIGAATLVAFAATGCTGASVGYRGRETTPIAKATDIVYSDFMPDDHEAIGTLDMQCRTTQASARSSASYGGGSSPAVPLVNSGNTGVDVAVAGVGLLFLLLARAARSGSAAPAASIPASDICGDADVERAARERAAAVGGDLISGVSCNGYGTGTTLTSQCTAEVGRRMDEKTLASFPPDEVRARFLPAPDKPQTASMPLGQVKLTDEAPRPAMFLGTMTGGCLSGCTRETIEPRMREAAARAGAPVLSGVECAPEQGAFICRAKAWLPIERFTAGAPPASDPK